MSQPTLTSRCWLSIADLGDIDFTSFISRCWLSEDGLLFHLAIGMKSTGGQPLASTRCGQQFVVGQAAADIPDTKKCYQCYLSAAAYAPSGDAEFETATANPPQGSSAVAEAGDAGARLSLEYPAVAETLRDTQRCTPRLDAPIRPSLRSEQELTAQAEIAGDGNRVGSGRTAPMRLEIGQTRARLGASVEAGSNTSDVSCGHGVQRDSATGTSSSRHETAAGIPIHDEALALALDEGQNASNRWRLERHMSGQHSGTLLDEMSGLVARAERGELRR